MGKPLELDAAGSCVEGAPSTPAEAGPTDEADAADPAADPAAVGRSALPEVNPAVAGATGEELALAVEWWELQAVRNAAARQPQTTSRETPSWRGPGSELTMAMGTDPAM
jgi:hypothetical protein